MGVANPGMSAGPVMPPNKPQVPSTIVSPYPKVLPQVDAQKAS